MVRGATRIEVQNSLGEYDARIIQLDPTADLALLKIDDTSYHAFNGLPYGISKTDGELGEDLFILGYPRPEIVYGQGYLSAATGFEGDTTEFQLTIAANPGNSGTPVLNNDGQVIGIVSGSQHNAQGMVFAVRSRNIFRAIDSIMKQDSTLLKSRQQFRSSSEYRSSPPSKEWIAKRRSNGSKTISSIVKSNCKKSPPAEWCAGFNFISDFYFQRFEGYSPFAISAFRLACTPGASSL